jgi:SAM-dependent methyltransferase
MPNATARAVKDSVKEFVRYPIEPEPTKLERVIRRIRFGGIARCPVCGSITAIVNVRQNLRESCNCARCRSTNRQRQIAYVLCSAATALTGQRISSLAQLVESADLTIYNTEAGRQVHKQLSKMPGYLCSEYFGDHYKSGEMVQGKMHQDLMDLSFEDGSIDIVVSSDVFEHIVDPYKAHKEVRRVLKEGGRHVFTVPFLQTEFLDQQRTFVDLRGNIVHLAAPIYHGDPVRDQGALVHRIFGLEMLVNLRKIGFRTNMYKLYKPSAGIVGPNAIVFEAIKM